MPINNSDGWIYDPKAIDAICGSLDVPMFGDAAPNLKGYGEGKTVLLYKAYDKVKIPMESINQGSIGSCFPAGSKVLMHDGLEKNIENVVIGDLVVTHNNNHKKVTKTFSRNYSGELILTEDGNNGEYIYSTPDHKFYTDKNQFEEISKIDESTKILKKYNENNNGRFVVVQKTVIPNMNLKVYCIEVENDHSFICNGYAVSNCVAAALAGVTDLTKVVEISNGERSEFKATTSIEHIYRIARLNQNMRGDGASTGTAVNRMGEMGTVCRLKYDFVDLTKYSVDRCRQWGDNRNYPKQLDAIAKEHTIKKFSRVRSYEEVRDAIAAGYAVAVGSSYGYNSICDKNGFARQDTGWNHCMYWSAIRSDIPGVLTQNSWGNWNKMSNNEFSTPEGSFWIRPEDCDKMAKSDCWVIGAHEGYPIRINSEVVW